MLPDVNKTSSWRLECYEEKISVILTLRSAFPSPLVPLSPPFFHRFVDMASAKKYGLIVPSKKNVFGDDSDSNSDDGGDWVKKSLKRVAQKSALKRSTKIQLKKAIEEDPTVFQYDEIYDDLEQKKVEAKEEKKGVEKKPRYIQALLQTAERRKKENERRVERQVQKEREEEGNQFADKESFVTSSYRQKLEEFKKQEEEEQRMERLEAIGDVTRQKDLTGFYRHLLRQTMGETLPGANNALKSDKEDVNAPKDENSAPESSEQSSKPPGGERKKDRHYRKRRSSSSGGENSDEEKTDLVAVKEEKDVDADSNFTGSSSSSSDNGSGSEEGEIRKKPKTPSHKEKDVNEVPKKKQKTDAEGKKDKTIVNVPPSNEKSLSTVTQVKEEKLSDEEDAKPSKEKTAEDKSGNTEDESSEKVKIEVKPKINIWEKRTVGQAYDDAVQRYYERKAARTASQRA